MDDATLTAARRSLHGVAELVIAVLRFRILNSIELRVRPGGIGGAVADIAIVGTSSSVRRSGCRSKGHAGLSPYPWDCKSPTCNDVYATGSGMDADEDLSFDPKAVNVLLDWFGRGDSALRRFCPDQTPVLWPEHFDVGITWEGVNYGA